MVLLYSFLYLESVHKVKVSSGQKQHFSSCLDFKNRLCRHLVAVQRILFTCCPDVCAWLRVYYYCSIKPIIFKNLFLKMQISTLFQGIS